MEAVTYLHSHLPAHVEAAMSAHAPPHLCSVYLSICLSVYLSICLSVYLSICLSVRYWKTKTMLSNQGDSAAGPNANFLDVIYLQVIGPLSFACSVASPRT